MIIGILAIMIIVLSIVIIVATTSVMSIIIPRPELFVGGLACLAVAGTRPAVGPGLRRVPVCCARQQFVRRFRV